MKFLCIPCDEQMETQTEGIMPKEQKNISLKFKCKKCGHMIAMLTNQFETEFVSKLGVEAGGPTSVSDQPLSSLGSSLADGREELKRPTTEDELEWTAEAKERINKVPFFVRGMAKKTVINFAIERGIKGEIAEDFISGLKKLFEDHYIDVPDEKYNVLEDQANKIEELEKKLNEQVEKNVELNKANGEMKRQDIIDEMSSDLADTAKEKFNKLAEEVEYSNEKDFTTKVSTIKESYFGKKVEASGNEIDEVVAGDSSQPEDLSNAMAAYTAAISKTKDIKLSNK